MSNANRFGFVDVVLRNKNLTEGNEKGKGSRAAREARDRGGGEKPRERMRGRSEVGEKKTRSTLRCNARKIGRVEFVIGSLHHLHLECTSTSFSLVSDFVLSFLEDFLELGDRLHSFSFPLGGFGFIWIAMSISYLHAYSMHHT